MFNTIKEILKSSNTKDSLYKEELQKLKDKLERSEKISDLRLRLTIIDDKLIKHLKNEIITLKTIIKLQRTTP